MNYSNGMKLGISDVVRMTFLDGVDDQIKIVGEVAMSFEALKRMRDAIVKIIDDHEVKLAKLAE